MVSAAILGLVQAAPMLMGLFNKNETAAKAVDVAVTVAKAITGQPDEDKALEALKADPAAMLKYQESVGAQAATMYAEETKRLETVNETIRAEVASSDKFVSRMRPFFGYCVAVSWSGMMAAIIKVIWTSPTEAPLVINAMASMGTIWSVALSVLGVYVYKRSEDKKPPKQGIGALGALMSRIRGG